MIDPDRAWREQMLALRQRFTQLQMAGIEPTHWVWPVEFYPHVAWAMGMPVVRADVSEPLIALPGYAWKPTPIGF